jgi:beta-mannan synthase
MAGAAAAASLAAVAAGWLDLDGSTPTSTAVATLLPRLWRWPWPWSSGVVVAEALRSAWDAARAAAVAPALAAASWACLALSAMLLADAVFLAAASLLAPAPRGSYRRAAGPVAAVPEEDGGDEEAGGRSYPMVLVQIPMYNEREVRAHSIVLAAHAMRWICSAYHNTYAPFPLCVWACRCTSFPLQQRAGWHGRPIGSSYKFSTIPLIQRSR